MITSNPLRVQHLHNWQAVIHVVSGSAGVVIGLMFATTLGWLN